MRVADTSALYAAFDDGDSHHQAAKVTLAEPQPIIVPGEILVETAGLIGRRFGQKAAKAAIGSLLALPHLRVRHDVDMEAAARLFIGAPTKLSLADCVVIQTCRALNLPALTFDKHILRAVGRPTVT